MLDNQRSDLQIANHAFRQTNPIAAIRHYRRAQVKASWRDLDRTIEFNISLLTKRLREQGGTFAVAPEGLAQSTISLVPISQVEAQTSKIWHWKSSGKDPSFLVQHEQGTAFAAGWYIVSVLLECAKTASTPRHSVFYIDSGDGFSELNSFRLSYADGELAERVIYLKSKCSTIRFDPLDDPTHFNVLAFGITTISKDAAIQIMLSRITGTTESPLDESAQRMKEKFRARAKENNNSLAVQIWYNYRTSFDYIPGRISYTEWIEKKERPSLPTPRQLALALQTFPTTPLISVIMPTFNTDENFLHACIDSVLAQSYRNWELCIADDASPKVHVRNVLEAYARQDSRIRIVWRAQNGHISNASNSALDIAQGEFVALLDHDDTLPEHAIYFMVEAINEHPDAQIFYSDEDKIDRHGERVSPHFKSDWNPDLFFSQNYVSHLGVYRRELLERIEGFRVGVEGSQDYDLLLRCLPHVVHDQIVHIPRVLYHWRMVEGSTALASGEKSYTSEAGAKALREYFEVHNPDVTVESGASPNIYRLRYPVPTPSPLVSLLIPTRDRRALTETCVRSILSKSNYTNFEILILDNGSVQQETLDFFVEIQQQDARVRVLRYDLPFNYSAINNFGIRHATGSVIGLINNDIEVISSDWLTEMLSHAVRPEIGCVGAKLYFENDTVQHAGVICGLGGVASHSHKHFSRDEPGYFHRLATVQTLSAVTAACLVVRRKIYEEVGGLDEQNLTIAFNDVDFCLKVRGAGYRNLWTPYAELYHYESVSRGTEDTPAKVERFNKEVEFMQSKWGDLLFRDPYYNPNLTTAREDFSLAD